MYLSDAGTHERCRMLHDNGKSTFSNWNPAASNWQAQKPEPSPFLEPEVTCPRIAHRPGRRRGRRCYFRAERLLGSMKGRPDRGFRPGSANSSRKSRFKTGLMAYQRRNNKEPKSSLSPTKKQTNMATQGWPCEYIKHPLRGTVHAATGEGCMRFGLIDTMGYALSTRLAARWTRDTTTQNQNRWAFLGESGWGRIAFISHCVRKKKCTGHWFYSEETYCSSWFCASIRRSVAYNCSQSRLSGDVLKY